MEELPETAVSKTQSPTGLKLIEDLRKTSRGSFRCTWIRRTRCGKSPSSRPVAQHG